MVFGEILFEVDTSKYEAWVEETKARFPKMLETMKNVARIIELGTIPFVPLDTSALEQSYDYQVVGNSNFILLGMGYDAVDEDSGFHYAEYQHSHELHHPKRGTSEYLLKGIIDSKGEWMELIETDYLSLFTGSAIKSGSFGQNNGMSKHEYKMVYRSYEWSR